MGHLAIEVIRHDGVAAFDASGDVGVHDAGCGARERPRTNVRQIRITTERESQTKERAA